jgi:hypothetical protein
MRRPERRTPLGLVSIGGCRIRSTRPLTVSLLANRPGSASNARTGGRIRIGSCRFL